MDTVSVSQPGLGKTNLFLYTVCSPPGHGNLCATLWSATLLLQSLPSSSVRMMQSAPLPVPGLDGTCGLWLRRKASPFKDGHKQNQTGEALGKSSGLCLKFSQTLPPSSHLWELQPDTAGRPSPLQHPPGICNSRSEAALRSTILSECLKFTSQLVALSARFRK